MDALSDSWCYQDSNAVNESSWDTHGVEIEACANFKRKLGIRHFLGILKKNS